jgi:hypothetical protein
VGRCCSVQPAAFDTGLRPSSQPLPQQQHQVSSLHIAAHPGVTQDAVCQ